jgi:hypothetical protein
MVDLATEAREANEAGEYVGLRRGQEVLLTGAATKLGPCQVRSKTDHPCPHQAVMEIWGIPFCERCAREQEAYFDIGKLHDAAARVSVQPRAFEAYGEAGKR